MIDLVRPRSFVPVHGTIHHLTRHAALAREAGVAEVCVIENGRVAEVAQGRVMLGEAHKAGRVHVWGGKEVAPQILRERAALAEEGVATAVVCVDHAGSVTECLLSTRGVADDPDELASIRGAIRAVVAELDATADDATIAEHARLAIRRAFHKSRHFKPVTIVHVVRKEAGA